MENKITILCEEYFYELRSNCNEYYSYEWTIFYKNTYTKTRKKYWLFGPIIIIENPIELFRVQCWITDSNITKAKLKTLLENAASEYKGLANRKEEIKRGELI